MRIDGSHVFEGPRDAVWALVRDPDTIRRLVPGIERLEEVADGEYRGNLRVGRGWIKVDYDVAVRVVEEEPPERLRLAVEGKGAFGDADGGLEIELAEAGPERTEMRWKAEVEIGGRAGAMAGMLEGVARERAEAGMAELDRLLERRRG